MAESQSKGFVNPSWFDDLPRDNARWVQLVSWAYCTETDCYGAPREDIERDRWCVYDAEEDDPAIATCEQEEDAAAIVWALNGAGEMLRVLDDVEACIRMSDLERLAKVAFIWSQNKDAILERRTTWTEQARSLRPPWLGGVQPSAVADG